MKANIKTYDVIFNDDNDSNQKNFINATEQDCISYIKANNGSNDSYFADYKGGVVSVVCNETGETTYEEVVK